MKELPKTSKNILMVGVGGQGTILATKILAQVFMGEGYDIKVSEIKGMAQRGGSVVTQVRVGERVYSPIIEEGEADIILAFERLEALRWVHYLKPGGTIIINDQAIPPVPVILGLQEYPTQIKEKIQSRVQETVVVDALSIADSLGNSKASNVVLLGVLASHSDLSKEIWVNALKEKVPAKFLELNQRAFDEGYNLRVG